MPMLRISVTQTEMRLHKAHGTLRPALRHALQADPGPVTIMMHGFKYHPGHPLHCPHGSLMARRPNTENRRIVSWPARLGMHRQPGEGLGISLGWAARGSIWGAHARAEVAGHALADLIRYIHAIAPGRPVNLIAHSLGARVALSAITASNRGAICRAILLAGAEYGETARTALDSEGGASTEILNVTSRENDLFDFMMERLIPPQRRGDKMLGSGLLRHQRLVTLQLDDMRSLNALRRFGFPVAPPERLICHWSAYLRDGVFPLYRAILNGDMSLEALRACLPSDPTPRWSRLRPRLPRPQPKLLPAE
jgi:pimeloyl-ACP methyl ester carboxylesterase